jgi:hypothetical protein
VDTRTLSNGRDLKLYNVTKKNVQYGTPDDGQRNCPKHVEFYYRINLIKKKSHWYTKKFSGVDCLKKVTNAWKIILESRILICGVIFKHKYNFVFCKCKKQKAGNEPADALAKKGAKITQKISKKHPTILLNYI